MTKKEEKATTTTATAKAKAAKGTSWQARVVTIFRTIAHEAATQGGKLTADTQAAVFELNKEKPVTSAMNLPLDVQLADTEAAINAIYTNPAYVVDGRFSLPVEVNAQLQELFVKKSALTKKIEKAKAPTTAETPAK